MDMKNGQPCGDDEVVYCENLSASEHFEKDTQNISANWDASKTLLDFENLEGRSCITSYQEFDNTLDQVGYLFKYTPKTDKNRKVNCKDAETKLDTEMGEGHQNSLQTIVASEHLEEDTEPYITSKHNYIKCPEVTSKAVSNTTLSPEEPNLFANGDISNSSLNLEEMVDESCDNSFPDFDNTLEEIDYILKNAPITDKRSKAAETIKLNTEMGNSHKNNIQTICASEHFDKDTQNISANWDASKTLLDFENLEGRTCITSYQEFDNTLDQVGYLLKYTPKTDKNRKVNCKDAETKLDTEMGEGHQNSLQTIVASEHLEEDTEPDITSKHDYIKSKPNLYANGDVSNSSLNLVEIVDESCDNSFPDFDNTLEEIDYILKNAPITDKHSKAAETIKLNTEMRNSHENNSQTICASKSAIVTPMKKEQIEKIFATSSSKPSSYKSQSNLPVIQKPSTSSLKKTPIKKPAFQHIASPVAYYINKSPRIPLIRNVHPKETLPGLPSSPELVKTTGFKPSNIEYVNLPSVAYKSAKETRVIDVFSAPKMPQSQWAKKLTQSNPRPAVIKHTHREKIINKHSETTNREPEDSFGDLSLDQAEISICTKKSA